MTGGDPPPTPIALIPLQGAAEFAVHQAYVDELAAAYPAVDIPQELKRARLWCLDNPTKKKTASGVRRFITGWMTRAQNDSRRAGPASTSSRPTRRTDFASMDYSGGDLEN